MRTVERDAFVPQVLEAQTQIVDCRSEDEFLGVKGTAPVAGHLLGALNVPFHDIFATDSGDGSTFLLPQQELKELFEATGINFDVPVAVVGASVVEVAAVATSLLISGHAAVQMCSAALSDEWVEQIPPLYTEDIFKRDALVFADGDGQFDLSADGDSTQHIEEDVAKDIEKNYSERLDGKDEFGDKQSNNAPTHDDNADEVVWITEGRRYFDMPSAVSKEEFLDASGAIYRVISFVLAPFGFPNALHDKLTLSEVKTQCGSLFQDVIEVCSDLIYQHKNLTEGAMAMSVHKWVEDKHDHDCTKQVKAINEVWDVLYNPPRFVEVPDLDEELVMATAIKLQDKMLELVSRRTPWAFDIADPVEPSHEPHTAASEEKGEVNDGGVESEATVSERKADIETNDAEQTDVKAEVEEKHAETNEAEDPAACEAQVAESEDESSVGEESADTKPNDDESANVKSDGSDSDGETVHQGAGEDSNESEDPIVEDSSSSAWRYMYPSVIYALGFIPGDSDKNQRKLSTLQIKSFIQAVAEATWEVTGDVEKLSAVEFQALCDTLSAEKRSSLKAFKSAAEEPLYVVNHFLTRSLAIEQELIGNLASVRSAVADGDRKLRSSRHAAALGAYAKAFDHLPIHHKSLDKILVGRSNCFVELGEMTRAKTEAEIALKLNPFSAGAYNCLGKVEEKSSHPQQAMQHYVTSFILDGSRSQEHAESIDRVSRLVGREVAKGLFDEMVKVHELPSTWLVDSYFEAFEHDADYSTCLPSDIAKKVSIDQADVDALTLLHRAIFHKRNKDYSDAQRDIWALTAMDMEEQGLTAEQQALALNLHSSLLYVAGDVHAALEVIDKSLALHPTSVNGLVKKGGFLSEIGETDEATSCFAEAMELDPNDADVHLHMGQMYLLDGDYQGSVQSLRRCISRSDALPVTHVSYGMALYKSGSIYQANDVFDEAIAAFPESAEVNLFHGEVLADQGNYAQAMRRFLRAFELSPECPLPFLNAGRVYVGTNDPMRAIAHFQQALAIDPRCSSAHLDIAQVLFAQGRTDEAFEHFEAAAACCRFLPEVEEVCSCREMARMQLKVTEILGVELRHIMRSK